MSVQELVDLHQRRPLVREAILQLCGKRRAPAKENNDEENDVVGQCCNNWHGPFYSTRESTGHTTISRDSQSRSADGGGRLSSVQGHRQQRPQRREWNDR